MAFRNIIHAHSFMRHYLRRRQRQRRRSASFDDGNSSGRMPISQQRSQKNRTAFWLVKSSQSNSEISFSALSSARPILRRRKTHCGQQTAPRLPIAQAPAISSRACLALALQRCASLPAAFQFCPTDLPASRKIRSAPRFEQGPPEPDRQSLRASSGDPLSSQRTQSEPSAEKTAASRCNSPSTYASPGSQRHLAATLKLVKQRSLRRHARARFLVIERGDQVAMSARRLRAFRFRARPAPPPEASNPRQTSA